MWKADSSGKVLGIGYQPGKSATLVRNPNWNASTDFRPAYLDQINITHRRRPERDRPPGARRLAHGPERHAGAADRQARLRKIPQPAGDLAGRRATTTSPSTTSTARSRTSTCARRSGRRSTAKRWTRRAAASSSATSLTHFIYPEIPGFEQAGGYPGPKVDYNEHPAGRHGGRRKVHEARRLPERQVHRRGRRVQVVGSTGTPAPEDAQIANQTLQEPRLQNEAQPGRPVGHVLQVLRRRHRKDRRLPERRLDRRLRRPAGGARRAVQRQATSSTTGPTPTGARSTYPKINKAMDAARNVVGEQARARSRGRRSTANSSKKPSRSRYDWDKQPNIESKDVAGVGAALERRCAGTTASPR